MSSLTLDSLKKAGHDARANNSILEAIYTDGRNVRGSCIPIANEMQDMLVYEDVPDEGVQKVRCFVLGEELHYCIAVDSSLISDTPHTSGMTLVDASIDQFCSEQKEEGNVDVALGSYDELPEVAVIPPDDSRKSWYKSMTIGGV